MKLSVLAEKCVGCGLCAETLPELFSIGASHARLKRSTLSAREEPIVWRIATDCPAGAILFEAELPRPRHIPFSAG